MNISRRSRLGWVLVLGVVPALVVGLVLGPHTWKVLTAGIDLPVSVGGLATGTAVIWLVAALVAWVALWAAERGRTGCVAAGAMVAVLLLGGTFAGNALSEAGCAHGREEIIAHLVPLGGARATFSENILEHYCWAQYTTTAARDDVFAHHGTQLTSRGWMVTPPSDRMMSPPYLEARRGDLAVYVWVDPFNGENMVRLVASGSG